MANPKPMPKVIDLTKEYDVSKMAKLTIPAPPKPARRRFLGGKKK